MQEHLFNVGDLVEVLKPIDLLPYTVLAPGERGAVVKVIDDMGIHGVEVEMKKQHEGLKVFDNRALLTEPEINYIEEVGAREYKPLSIGTTTFVLGGLVTALGSLKVHAVILAVVSHGFLNLM